VFTAQRSELAHALTSNLVGLVSARRAFPGISFAAGDAAAPSISPARPLRSIRHPAHGRASARIDAQRHGEVFQLEPAGLQAETARPSFFVHPTTWMMPIYLSKQGSWFMGAAGPGPGSSASIQFISYPRQGLPYCARQSHRVQEIRRGMWELIPQRPAADRGVTARSNTLFDRNWPFLCVEGTENMSTANGCAPGPGSVTPPAARF